MNEQLQAGIDAINAATIGADESQQLVAAKCRGLLRGYHARWAASEYVPVAVETVVTADLFNPLTQARSRSFSLAGKLDVLIDYRGQRLLMDHKTTSQDIADPNAPYWRQLVVESQASHYMLLEWLNGRKVDSAVWDAIRKPSISPKKLTKAEIASAAGGNSYFGYVLTTDERLAFTSSATDRETVSMYEARLAHDCTTERPEWYFNRRPVPRLDHEIVEHAEELWGHSQDLLSARRSNRWPRNSGACMLYGTPCQFLGICSGFDSPDSDKWRRKETVHAELPIIGDGRDVLTNSRIRCFQTCRRKHYYDYELGIERNDDEEREALFFGSLLHAGLEAWWKVLLPKGEAHERDNYSVSGIEQHGSEMAHTSHGVTG